MEKRFLWQGIDATGKKQTGILFATNTEALSKKLFDKNVFLLNAKEQQQSFWKNFNQKVSSKEVIYFFSGLFYLLESGLDLLVSLEILRNRLRIKNMQKTVDTIVDDIRRGIAFADALDKHKIFSDTIVHIIKLGESAGALEVVCKKVAIYLDWSKKFTNKVKRAIFLPGFTLSFAMIIIFLVFTFVLPRFESILLSLGKPLPYMTLLVFGISKIFGPIVVLSILCGFVLLIVLLRALLKKGVLWLPVVSRMMYLSDMVRFISSLSMLLGCSMSLVLSIEHARSVVKNNLLKEKVDTLVGFIKNGFSFESALLKVGGFPEELIAVVAVGENSGNLEFMLEKVIVMFEEDLDKIFYFLISVLQPTLIIIVGIIIALLMLAVYVPIFTITSMI